MIDREIILDQMLQNFAKGVSITELSIELWFHIDEIDIAKPNESKEKHLNSMPDRVKELLKDFDKASLLSTSMPF